MDVGIWKGTPKDEQDALLELAVDYYEYNKANNTLKDSLGHLHKLKNNSRTSDNLDGPVIN